ncbi:BA14K family protein [Bradyrhizobium sp. Ec3.3]|uniref:BA14K family protein n=1 Tax=Bradyrhizobium sp. Ec3.3 TaxID=189753 RepID=UPI000422730C|nr:BA14K family protein [Bradyrhizobium sp. Ec3.3]
MLKSFRSVGGVLLLASLTAGALSPASAAPIGHPLAVTPSQSANVEQVRWYGHRGFGGGAFVGGLAAGALIGGALAAPSYYGPGYPPPPPAYYAAPPADDAVAYCMQRYRSFDPNSGTFLGDDGRRHPCP